MSRLIPIPPRLRILLPALLMAAAFVHAWFAHQHRIELRASLRELACERLRHIDGSAVHPPRREHVVQLGDRRVMLEEEYTLFSSLPPGATQSTVRLVRVVVRARSTTPPVEQEVACGLISTFQPDVPGPGIKDDLPSAAFPCPAAESLEMRK